MTARGTLLHAWRWRDGGPWFGVPVSNYLGWLFADLLIYLTFWANTRRRPARDEAQWPAVALYALCAAGNALQLFTRLPQQVVVDATGRSWRAGDILAASALVSVFLMGGFVVVAALRLWRGHRVPADVELQMGR